MNSACRSFVALAVATVPSVLLRAAASETPANRLAVHAERGSSKIDHNFYGHFSAHLAFEIQ